MKTKNAILLIIGSVSLTWLCLWFFSNDVDVKKQLQEIVKERDSIVKLRDKGYEQRDSVISIIRYKNDSLKNKADKIKYIKYEKYTYVNRDIDSAIIVLSNYKYNSRTRPKD